MSVSQLSYWVGDLGGDVRGEMLCLVINSSVAKGFLLSPVSAGR